MAHIIDEPAQPKPNQPDYAAVLVKSFASSPSFAKAISSTMALAWAPYLTKVAALVEYMNRRLDVIEDRVYPLTPAGARWPVANPEQYWRN